MHTMQEFLTSTKGMGYIIAGLLMVLFVPFWLYLVDREKSE